MPKRILEYEIIDHGVKHEQYFQGCGVALTKYEDVATGIGNSLREALEDAAEDLVQQGYMISSDLGAEINRADDKDEVDNPRAEHDGPYNHEEHHYYASIRVKGE